MRITDPTQLDALDFDKQDGLVPAIAQHAHTGAVLMLAYANRAALERTLETGELWYWSRSRGELWHKGETSGNVQRLVSLHADCDADAVLALVLPAGPACHTGAETCFRPVAVADRGARTGGSADAGAEAGPSARADPAAALPTLPALAAVLARRAAERPEDSHTARLLADRNLRLKKLGEEAVELALACADRDATRAAEEAADLVYHALVACIGAGAAPEDVLAALDRRLPARA